MAEHHPVAQHLIDEKRLAHATTTVHSNEFGPTALIATGKLCNLLFSADNSAHTLCLQNCGAKLRINNEPPNIKLLKLE